MAVAQIQERSTPGFGLVLDDNRGFQGHVPANEFNNQLLVQLLISTES
jgi:hypothetical protein